MRSAEPQATPVVATDATTGVSRAYFQVSLVLYAEDVPVEYVRLLPDSHVTLPLASFFMYLYSKPMLCGTITNRLQVGYDAEESGIAAEVSQPPSAAIEPTT